MRANDKIRFWVETNVGIVDHTDGLMTLDITRGMNELNSPLEQVDAGIMRLVSRNPDLDPYLNADIRAGVKFYITQKISPTSNITLFTGKISGVTVEYQPKGKPQVVTITGLDMIGTMQQHILRDTFRTRLGGTGMVPGAFIQEINLTNVAGTDSEIIGFSSYPVSGLVSTANNDSGISKNINGQSAWETWSQAAKQGLIFAYANRFNTFYAWPHYENTVYPTSLTHPRTNASKLFFDSRGGQNSYYDVRLSDGFNYGCNRMTATYGSTSLPTVVSDESVELWGVLSKTFELTKATGTSPNYTIPNTFLNRVFEESVEPRREIKEISYDALNVTFASGAVIDIGDNINIYHEIDVLTFDKKYGVVGIRHHIDANDWETTLVLKNWYIADEINYNPIIVASPAAANTGAPISYSITNVSESEVTSVLWSFVGAHDTEPGSGTLYESSTDFNPIPVKYTSGGTYQVYVDVTNRYGIVRRSNILSMVVTTPLTNTWEYRINPSNNWLVELKFTGTGATSFQWTYSDGTTPGTRAFRGKKFTSGGTKTITLRATNDSGYIDVTKTITLASTNTVTALTGTKGFRYIYLRRGAATAYGTPEPIFKKLTLKRSNGTTISTPSTPKIIYAKNTNCKFYNANNDDITNTILTSPYNEVLTTNSTSKLLYGLRPVQLVYGTSSEWGVWLDLGDIYYDVDYIDLTLENPTGISTVSKQIYIDVDIYNYGQEPWTVNNSVIYGPTNFATLGAGQVPVSPPDYYSIGYGLSTTPLTY